MTDNEIIKALKCCVENKCTHDCPFYYDSCIKCRYSTSEIIKFALDLINRLQDLNKALINGQETLQKTIVEQKAEIERLQGRVEATEISKQKLLACFNCAKSEAIKEFAERLKTISHPYGDTQMVFELQIDNLVKEMTEVSDEQH